MKLVIWSSDKAKKELEKRLTNAKKFRKRYEMIWEDNERSLYNTNGIGSIPNVNFSFDSKWDLGLEDVDNSADTTGINYLFKNFRFIHAQLSANPPTVLARPTSSDPSDRRKADAADRLVRHAIRAESLQEKVDQASGKTLLYGTGWMKTSWNPHDGDIIDRDPETGEFELEGKINVYSPATWDVWCDPDARTWDEVRYIFERRRMTVEEAIFNWPDKEDEITQYQNDNSEQGSNISDESEEDHVDIYEYWETGLPVNGMLGRKAVCLDDGTLIEDPRPSPFSFSPPVDPKDIDPRTKKPRRMPPTAELPFHVFTDIDVPDEIYGKSFIEYSAPVQDLLNRLDSVTLDNVQAHGVARLVLPESCEIMEDSITNTPWDFIKYKGSQPPSFMKVPTLMPEMSALRDRLKVGGDDMAGVNESMFGQMGRETSGFSLQYATNQGNMIRRRMFNKYTLFVESIHKGYLNLVKLHWEEPRIIHVLGSERAFEAKEIKGADIDGGFDIVVEYGASLSLDPTTRREEILQLMPLFEKAGVDNRTMMAMLKLTELEGLYDIMEMAGQRQEEIFEEMIETARYIAPEDLQEHEGMLQYAYRYLMTAEFNNLPDTIKVLIKQHVKDREEMAAAGAAPDMGPMTPGAPPAGPEEIVAPTEGGIVPPQVGTPAAEPME